MKKFSNGFSLAEALLALAIIGIVSTIVMPHLSTNIQERKNAAILSKSMYLTEHACQEVIQEANLRSQAMFNITKLSFVSGYAGLIGEKLTGNNQAAINTTYTFQNTDYEFKFTMLANLSQNEFSDDQAALTIEFDANGYNNGPNRQGRDRLSFNVTNNCKLMPANNETRDFVKRGFKIQR